MKYLCKKSVYESNYGKKEIRFLVGEWYTATYQYPFPARQGYYNISDNDGYAWGFLKNRFLKHFYTQQEARELEIDKVLNL